MKFTKNDFFRAPAHTIDVDEWISIEDSDLLHHTQINSIPSAHIQGSLHFDGGYLVYSDLEVDGVMIVPDSITDEDVEVEFSALSQETYSFIPVEEDEQEIIPVKRETIDINPAVFQAILYEAPMSITKLSRDQYPSGDGWQLLSDQDEAEPEMDPRWEKLKDFKLDD